MVAVLCIDLFETGAASRWGSNQNSFLSGNFFRQFLQNFEKLVWVMLLMHPQKLDSTKKCKLDEISLKAAKIVEKNYIFW